MERQRLAKLEEDKRISHEIMERRKREEEQQKELKRQIEEERAREIERSKKLALEEKKKNLFAAPKKPEPVFPAERPKKKLLSNPFTQKFEEMAREQELEEKRKEEIAKRKEKSLMKMKKMVSRSRQMLKVLSKENLRSSKCRLAKNSRESLVKKSVEKLMGSRNSLRRSKTCINANLGKSQVPVTKKDMQNYLISQVIFDRQENLNTSRHNLEKIKEEENKKKEIARMEKEQEVKRQIEEELRRIKALEEEQKLKAQEDNFNRYKQDMESYLNFVCEEPSSKKLKKKIKRKEEDTKPKLKLNIKDIKNQFEEDLMKSETSSPPTDSTPFSPVKKLNAEEMFKQMEESSIQQPKKKKEYIPVIIDKDAFERTCKLFEKEKREEEERKANEERLRQRRAKMLEERERLIKQKEKEMQEEREYQERLEEMKRQEELAQALQDAENEENVEDNDQDLVEDSEADKQPEPVPPPVIDIHERIRQELEKLKQEEEAQRQKILRENKKRELMLQIKDQISQINSINVANTLNTSSWLNSSVETSPEVKGSTTLQDDLEIPRWIQIFNEKSKDLEAKAKKQEEEKKKRAEKAKAEQKYDFDDEEPVKLRNKEEKTKTTMKDRMRKVKSMIVDSTDKKQKQEKRKSTIVKKTTVKDFADFIAEKGDLLPSELKSKAQNLLTTKTENTAVLTGDPNMNEFNSYMDSLKSYLNEQDNNENESAFKQTISAYLDLLETKEERNSLDQAEKKIGKVDTSFLFENNQKQTQSQQVKVGKLDTAKIENLVKEKEIVQENKIIPEIKSATTSKLKNLFEQEEANQEFERVIVKQKLIQDSFAPNNDAAPIKEAPKYEWKYKQKTLEELHGFIKANSDMAPSLHLQQSTFKATLDDAIDSKELLDKSKQISRNMSSKEEEFEKFMKDLESFTAETSTNKDEELFKEELRLHLSTADKSKSKPSTSKTQKITTAFKLSDIKDRLTRSNETDTKPEDKKDIGKIGKIAAFQKKGNNESCDKSSLMKKNIELLLQPGKAKVIKKEFETAPKLKRSNSMLDFKPGKLNVKEIFFPQPEVDIEIKPKQSTKKYSVEKMFKSKDKQIIPDQPKVIKETKPEKKIVESEWKRIEDPEERKKAILAKYGFKAPREIVDDDSDVDDILNYEENIIFFSILIIILFIRKK